MAMQNRNSHAYKYAGIIFITFILANLLTFPSIILTHTLSLKSPNNGVETEAILPNLLNVKDTTLRNDPPHPSKQGPVKTSYQLAQDSRQTMERLKCVLGLNDTKDVLQFINHPTSTLIQSTSSILPRWSQIEERYGLAFPHILGLERCEEYRNIIVPNPQDRWVAPAGLFHTGTNLLAFLLAETCSGGNFQPHGQVPYGKHNPIQAATVDGYRIPKEAYQQVKNISRVLPIVMVRHPLDWMQSLCRQPFSVSWNTTSSTMSSSKLPCPSLDTPIQVQLYKNFNYDNVLDFWSDWYSGYLNYTEAARLVVRLEDLVYAPRETLQQICTCFGGSFRYDPRTLQERHGGTVRRRGGNKQHVQQKEKEEHFLVQAWRRHAGVSVESVLSSSKENQQLFRELETRPSMQALLQALNYNSIGPISSRAS